LPPGVAPIKEGGKAGCLLMSHPSKREARLVASRCRTPQRGRQGWLPPNVAPIKEGNKLGSLSEGAVSEAD